MQYRNSRFVESLNFPSIKEFPPNLASLFPLLCCLLFTKQVFPILSAILSYPIPVFIFLPFPSLSSRDFHPHCVQPLKCHPIELPALLDRLVRCYRFPSTTWLLSFACYGVDYICSLAASTYSYFLLPFPCVFFFVLFLDD